MTSRLKVFVIIALIGFLAGILAQVTATFVIPAIAGAMPSLGVAVPYLIAGFAGAVITVLIVGVWAYLTSRKEAF
jgi:hypothetical protein